MIAIQFAVVLGAIFIGARMGGIAIGFAGGLGVLVLALLGLKPGAMPLDVVSIIMSVIVAIAAMQVAGGMDWLVEETMPKETDPDLRSPRKPFELASKVRPTERDAPRWGMFTTRESASLATASAARQESSIAAGPYFSTSGFHSSRSISTGETDSGNTTPRGSVNRAKATASRAQRRTASGASLSVKE